MKRAVLIALMALAAVVSCGGDDPVTPVQTSRWPVPDDPEDVLSVIQRACNERNIMQYERVLDDGFTFYLAPADVAGGAPGEWDRAVEVRLVQNMFSKTPVAGLPLVKSLTMDLDFESGVTWVEIIPGSAPEETWYSATIFYHFQMELAVGDAEFVTVPGTKAQFVVRNAGTESAQEWRLVEMRDLGAPAEGGLHATASVDEITWGAAKALFLGTSSP